jgi:DNA repair exonuclease SbcCD nuclease subunit
MRFLHTADWQIGMKAAHAGAAAQRVRDARIDAIRRIQALSREECVDFVLVAGDTFEDHGVSSRLIGQVGDLLAGFDCPVYLIPGNHDPFVAGGVWDRASTQWSRRVGLLFERRPVEVPGGTLYPCPLYERWSDDDPTAWIPCEPARTIRIGMAHGSLALPLFQGERHHPINPEAAERAGLDYLALGDWHSVQRFRSRDGAERTAYSGTPEPCSFGEDASGFVLLIDIDAPGAAPRIEQRRVGRLQWKTVREEVNLPGQLARLIADLRAHPEPERTLVRLELGGLLFAAESACIDELDKLLASRFLYGRLDVSRLVPAPDDDAWIENLPAGSIREAARRLREAAAGDATAGQALLELYRIAQGGAA